MHKIEILDKKKEDFFMPLVDTIEKKPKYEFRIRYDEDSESPRDWGRDGTMLLKHGRYDLSFENDDLDKDDIEGVLEFINKLEEDSKVVILKVRMYDHGNISLSTDSGYPYNCQWDSSMVGFIYEKLKKGQTREELTSILKKEVEIYSKYLSGEVYWFSFIDNSTEEIPTCFGGIYADDLEKSCKDFLKSGETLTKLSDDEIEYLVKEALEEFHG